MRSTPGAAHLPPGLSGSTPRAPVSRVDVRAGDGVRLALHRVHAGDATPVLFVPGTFSNSTFWLGTRGAGFARDVGTHGFDAWVLDPRGHGASEMPAGTPSDWRFDDWGHDAAAVMERVFGVRGGFLVGHSAGGAALLVALARRPDLRDRVRGMILIGTPLPWLQPFSRIGARAIRGMSRLFNRFPARALRLGPEDELPGVMSQWMTWNLTARWIGDDGTDYCAALTDLHVPLLVVAAAADRWAPPPACHALLELVRTPDSTWLLCGRAAGFSRDFGHVDVLVGRAARAETWPLLRDWMTRRTPAGEGRHI